MIDRSKDRIKQTGEIFTPLPLVDEILDKLPPDQFTDPTKTFVDPAAGDGNFLIRVIAYKIYNGATPKQALSTTYGVDIMEDNISHCRGRLLTHAWLATTYKEHFNELLPNDMTLEDERQAGMQAGHDPFARKYNNIVTKNIICADSLNDWPFNDDNGLFSD